MRIIFNRNIKTQKISLSIAKNLIKLSGVVVNVEPVTLLLPLIPLNEIITLPILLIQRGCRGCVTYRRTYAFAANLLFHVAQVHEKDGLEELTSVNNVRDLFRSNPLYFVRILRGIYFPVLDELGPSS